MSIQSASFICPFLRRVGAGGGRREAAVEVSTVGRVEERLEQVALANKRPVTPNL